MAAAIADAIVEYLLEYERKTGRGRLGRRAVSRVALRPAVFAVAPLLLGGCVYYNGMYNTNRLAKSARKAERDGRTFEANTLGPGGTKADSVVVRHPHSKYADEADVLRGAGALAAGTSATRRSVR